MARVYHMNRKNLLVICILVQVVIFGYMCYNGPCGIRRLHKLGVRIFGPNTDVPIFLTGGSSDTYHRSKAFLEKFYTDRQRHFGGFELIFVDLGMTRDQIMDIAEFCRPCECSVTQIPELNNILNVFDVEPGFSEAFVMRSLWNEVPYFMWIDTSIILNSTVQFTKLFKRAKKNGLQISVGTGFIDDQYALTPDHFALLGENPMYYQSKSMLDTSWTIVGNVDHRTDAIFSEYLQCAKRSLCDKSRIGEFCDSKQKVVFTVKQCQAILALRLCKEFDDCYRSFAFSPEPYLEIHPELTCLPTKLDGY